MSSTGVFIIGLIVGSFLNAWIWRSRVGHSVMSGRSICPKCKQILRWYELIPLLSFLIQGRRCRSCKAEIDCQYPLVELAVGLLFVMNYKVGVRNYGLSSDYLFFTRQLVEGYLLSVLVVLFVYDLRFGLVPDRVVLPAIVAAFVYQLIRLFITQTGDNRSVVNDSLFLILAIFVGAGFFWMQYRISRGRWLGEGDMRIGALMGAMLSWPRVWEGLVVAYLIGGVIGITLLIAGRKRFGQTLPLGTFLTAGAAITFLYGDTLWNWYFRL